MLHVSSSFRYAVRCVALVTVGAGECFGAPVTTISDNGDPSNRVDFVVLGDGYTVGEMNKFALDVDRLVLQFDGFFAEEPFQEYLNYFNVHRIDVISNESGADHPERGEFKDTAFDASFNCGLIQRRICVNNLKVNDVLDASLGPNQRDIVLVLVNDPQFGGAGGAIATASVPQTEDIPAPGGNDDGACDPGEMCFTSGSFVTLVLHEMGHSFGLLADEYTGDGPACNNAVEPPEANVTRHTNRNVIKWNATGGPPFGWIDPATPIPTMPGFPGIPGLYEGAKYCEAGLYRPTSHSKMASLSYNYPFEQINEEQLVKRIYNFVSPLETSRPAESIVVAAVGQQRLFEVEVPSPTTHPLEITWYVDGQVAAAGAQFGLDTTGLGPPPGVLHSPHTVGVLVRDTTPKVRNDSSQVMREARVWDVHVTAHPAVTVDLRLETLVGECLWRITRRGRDDCLRAAVAVREGLGPLYDDTALQVRLVLGPPDDPLGGEWDPAELADERPKQYGVGVTGYRRVVGPAPRQRNPELISHVVVVAFDAEGQVLSWVATPDPRLVRAEAVDSSGDVPDAKTSYWPRADLSIALPDDPNIRTLGVYEPEWTGEEFILKPVGEAALPDQRRTKG
jgi:IgA Peptidase M64